MVWNQWLAFHLSLGKFHVFIWFVIVIVFRALYSVEEAVYYRCVRRLELINIIYVRKWERMPFLAIPALYKPKNMARANGNKANVKAQMTRGKRLEKQCQTQRETMALLMPYSASKGALYQARKT